MHIDISKLADHDNPVVKNQTLALTNTTTEDMIAAPFRFVRDNIEFQFPDERVGYLYNK